jgi:hypothetical protein
MEEKQSAKPSAQTQAEPAITTPIQLELFGLTEPTQPWGPLPTIIEPTVTGGNIIDDRDDMLDIIGRRYRWPGQGLKRLQR